jgi:hypothetical protein
MARGTCQLVRILKFFNAAFVSFWNELILTNAWEGIS